LSDAGSGQNEHIFLACSFAAAAPRVWNGLPDTVCNSALSEDIFCETVEVMSDEVHVGCSAFDVYLAPLNKLIIIIFIINAQCYL